MELTEPLLNEIWYPDIDADSNTMSLEVIAYNAGWPLSYKIRNTGHKLHTLLLQIVTDSTD